MIVVSVDHTNIRDSCPTEKNRSYERDASKDKELESEEDSQEADYWKDSQMPIRKLARADMK